jgi:hypothetical protein
MLGLLHWFIGKKSPAALFSDISFVSGGKKRGFCRLLLRVATPGRRFFGRLRSYA